LNFKRSKDLVRFFREFNNKVLTDSCGFKAKLLVDFAQLQQIPDLNYAKPNPACGSYKTSRFYQQFLQKHPEFVPKSPTNQEFDFDNPDLSAMSPLRTRTENEMEKVIDTGLIPDASLFGPKFADIEKGHESKLKNIETPLTAYVIKKLRRGRKDKPAQAPTAPSKSVDSKPEPSDKDTIIPSSHPSASAKSTTRRERPKVKKTSTAQANVPQQIQTGSNNLQQNQAPVHSAKPIKVKQQQQQQHQHQKQQQSRPRYVPPVDQIETNSQTNNKNNVKSPPVPHKTQKPEPQQTQTHPQTPKNAPKILARKLPAPVHDVPPVPSVTVAVQPTPKEMAPKKVKNKAPKKDSIRALLNSDQGKVENTASAKPVRSFTTAAKNQESQ
jgi:hypothetical protein